MKFNPINITISKVSKVIIENTKYDHFKVMTIIYEDGSESTIDIMSVRDKVPQIEILNNEVAK